MIDKTSEIEIMARIVFLILLCLFPLLNNAENFKSVKDRIFTRLRKQPSALGTSPFIARRSHRCYANCYFIIPFNGALVLPSSCEAIETNYTCEMTAIFDYSSKELLVYDYRTTESLIIQNTTYDSATSHLVSLAFNDSTILHIFTYNCANGDYCEWIEMQQIIPKLIALDYQPLYNLLLPTVFNSGGRPNTTQCYNGSSLVSCASGLCRYYQSVDNDYHIQTTRSCHRFESDLIEFEVTRHSPGPSRYDYSTLSFICDQDRCNDESKETVIRQIISSNGNEYLTISTASSGLNLSWLLISFSFFYILIIRYC